VGAGHATLRLPRVESLPGYATGSARRNDVSRGFFEIPDPQTDEDLELDEDQYEGPYSAPWIGGVVALDLLVARSGQAAVVVNRMAAFPDGFSPTLEMYLHRPVKGRRNHAHPMMWAEYGPARSVPDELLRFGLA
jgi:hypothetical protein